MGMGWSVMTKLDQDLISYRLRRRPRDPNDRSVIVCTAAVRGESEAKSDAPPNAGERNGVDREPDNNGNSEAKADNCE